MEGVIFFLFVNEKFVYFAIFKTFISSYILVVQFSGYSGSAGLPFGLHDL